MHSAPKLFVYYLSYNNSCLSCDCLCACLGARLFICQFQCLCMFGLCLLDLCLYMMSFLFSPFSRISIFVSKRSTCAVEFQQGWKVGCKPQTIRQKRVGQVPDCKRRRTFTHRPHDSQERCPFSATVTIGRRQSSASNEWFLILGEANHAGHYPPRVDALTKPTRLYSKEELQAVQDVLASYSGEGVAKSLYYYRTGEILSRSTLDWLKVFVFYLVFQFLFVLILYIFGYVFVYLAFLCLWLLIVLIFYLNLLQYTRQYTPIRTWTAVLQ